MVLYGVLKDVYEDVVKICFKMFSVCSWGLLVMFMLFFLLFSAFAISFMRFPGACWGLMCCIFDLNLQCRSYISN